jgi:hypothetical protein
MLSADLVLRNGKVLTLDSDATVAQAVGILGDRILAVGSDEDVASLVGPRTRVINVGGRTVIPGLHDSHLHSMMAAVNDLAVPFENARSIADMQAALAARAATTPPGEWILGSSSWHESQLAEGRLPVRHELDAVTPHNPVMIRRGGHVITVNSAALAIAGVTRETPDPPSGVIVRDPATREPTGVLVEPAAFGLILKHVPRPTRPQQVAALKKFTTKLNGRGITCTLEPGITLDEIAAFMELWRDGAMTVRTRILQRVNCIDDVTALSSILAPDFGDDWLRIGGFKAMADGGVEAAYMSEPYRLVAGEQNDPDFVGRLILPPGGIDELRQMFEIAAERRWQVQVHAVGDATIAAIVDLMEEVDRKHSIRGCRWVVMHVFLPRPESLAKMRHLGLRATVQNHPVKLGHNMIRYWGEARAARAIPVRSILAAGIATGGGTDAPVVNWNPFESLWWMTTRKVFVQGDVRVLGPDEAITREQALRLYTGGSAEAAFMEDRLGSLEPRKLADLAVLTADPLTAPEDELRDIRSVLTVTGGKIVHEAGL